MTQKMGTNFLPLLAKLEKNQSLTVKQIIYDNGINQEFNQNIGLSQLKNYELVLPIMKNLFGASAPKVDKLLPQLERVAKKWDGPLLVDNLLALDLFQQDSWSLFEKSASNLLTLLPYYEDSQSLFTDEAVCSEEQLLQVVQAYIQQFHRHLLKESLTSYQHSTSNNFLPLAVLLQTVSHRLSFAELLVPPLLTSLASCPDPQVQSPQLHPPADSAPDPTPVPG